MLDAYDEENFHNTMTALDELVFEKIKNCYPDRPEIVVFNWAEEKLRGYSARGQISKNMFETIRDFFYRHFSNIFDN